MLRILTTLVLILPATPAPATSPIAEVVCAPQADMVRRLSQSFGESRRATGLRSPEEVVEIWTDDRGDWTMIITYATGQSCIVAMGQGWTPHDPA